MTYSGGGGGYHLEEGFRAKLCRNFSLWGGGVHLIESNLLVSFPDPRSQSADVGIQCRSLCDDLRRVIIFGGICLIMTQTLTNKKRRMCLWDLNPRVAMSLDIFTGHLAHLAYRDIVLLSRQCNIGQTLTGSGNLGGISESEKMSFQMVTERNYAI